jgi:hypothetical protein
MNRCGKNFKQRGEWVELQFMAAAASHGYHLLKPWGDSLAYDVGIDQSAQFLRVQVKSTSSRRRSGYYCRFRGGSGETGYDLASVDLFASYVIPTNVWYMIPASVILTPKPIRGILLCPEVGPHFNRNKYELYREAWGLLGKSKSDLARPGKPS